MKGIFLLARRNMVAYKKLYIRLLVAFVALVFLITLVSCFTLSVRQKQEGIVSSSISSNYTFDETAADSSVITQDFDTLVLKRYELEKTATALTGYESIFFGYDDMGLNIGGKFYPYKNGGAPIFSAYSVCAGNVFTANDYCEAGENAMFMLGRFPEKEDEIVVSQDYLEGCGLTLDAIGLRLSFCIIKYDDPNSFGRKIEATLPISSELEICGILLNDYLNLSGRRNFDFRPALLLHKSQSALYVPARDIYMCSFNGWATLDTEKYIKDAGLNYCGMGALRDIRLTESLQNVVEQLTLYFVSALILGIVFTVFLLIERLCAHSAKLSGVMQISGLTEKQVFSIWIVQILFVSLVSLILAALLTYGAMAAINKIINHTFWMRLEVSVGVFFAVAAIGLSVVIALSAMAFAYVAFKRKDKRPRDLLDT